MANQSKQIIDAVGAVIEMAVRPTEYSQAKGEYDAIVEKTLKLLARFKDYEFSEVKDAAFALHQALLKEKLGRNLSDDEALKANTKLSIKPAVGPVADPREILEILRDNANQRLDRWLVYEENVGPHDDLPDFATEFGLEVERAGVKRFVFSRITESRDQFSHLQILVFPGHIYVELIGNDRTSDDGQLLNGVEELAEMIGDWYGDEEWE